MMRKRRSRRRERHRLNETCPRRMKSRGFLLMPRFLIRLEDQVRRECVCVYIVAPERRPRKQLDRS